MKDDAGFTLVELLVVMALTLVAVTLAGSMYLFLSRAVTSWQEEVCLANAFHTTLTRFSDDLYDAVAVLSGPDSTLAITRADGDVVAYAWRDGALRRQDRIMHDTTDHVADFRLVVDSSSGVAGFEVHLALAARRRVLEATTRVNRRHPPPWPP